MPHVRLLYLTDRISLRGGADQHLLQVIRSRVGLGEAPGFQPPRGSVPKPRVALAPAALPWVGGASLPGNPEGVASHSTTPLEPEDPGNTNEPASRGLWQVTVAAGRLEPEVPLPDEIRTVRVRGLARPVASSARLGALRELIAEAGVIHAQNVMNPVALRMAVESGRAVVTMQDHRAFCPGPGKTLPDGSRCLRSMSDAACAECLPGAEYRARTLALTRERLEAMRGAARVLVLSRYMAEELERAGLPNAEVLPPWVEASESEPQPGEGFLIGGRLVKHKGMTDAWRAWRDSGTDQPLQAAGEGPEAGRLEGAELLGWLPGPELRQRLREARALIFPGFWQEPFGILGVEALAEGTPVIVARTGGTGDWSDQGCIAVPPGDVAAMAAAIRRLARDPELAVALGRAGREMVRRRFARSRLQPRLAEVYRAV